MSERARVKICGVTDVDDARLAAELGAWAIGLIFHPPSPRRCEVDAAVAIGRALRRRAEVCGVFVNAPLDHVAATADAVGLTMVQLHGEEGPSFCDEVARRTGARVMKAVRVRSPADIQAVQVFRRVDFHLLDAHADGVPGGTGQTFDWALLAKRRSRVPLVLSGGLTAENVGEGIERVRPWGVDVASGVEAQPGHKDPVRLEAFFAAVRRAGDEGDAAGSAARREEATPRAAQRPATGVPS
ncbi:MAG: phosphoribosylanthranilate isomerase [Solirubrobacteraceae bacterium]